MPLHAGFAAAISISQDALQQIIHLEYINETFPTEYKNSFTVTNNIIQPNFTFKVAVDFFLAEPLLILEPNPGDFVKARFEMIGNIRCSATGIKTVTCLVDVIADVQMPVIMITDKKKQTIQFGLDSQQAFISFFKATISSGENPKHKYGFEITDAHIQLSLLKAVYAIKPDQFLITVPSLNQFLQVNYTLIGPAIVITKGSINAGIDVKKLTSGDRSKLINLNEAYTVRGWLKKLAPVHTADDEYGSPIYEYKWKLSEQLQNDRHHTQIAVALNKLVVNDLYKRIGRYELIYNFETNKYNSVVSKLQSLKSKSDTYNPPQIAQLVLHKADITLHNDHSHIEANVTYCSGSIDITTDVHINLRIVQTEVLGETSFVMSHQNRQGFTGEITELKIDTPAIVTILEVFGAVVGVLLAPFTYGMSLMVTVMFEEIISSIASDLIFSAEKQAANSIMTGMGTNSGILRFHLPNIKKPDLVLQPQDIVVRKEGLYSWFIFYVDYEDTSTAYIDVVNYPKTYSDNTGWPIQAAQKIHVKYFEKGRLYNPHDPKVRIRWQVFGNSTKHKLLETDTAINNSTIDDPLSVYIDHASPDYMPYSKFIVKCRVYRPLGNTVTHIFKQTITVNIIDKLNRSKPYVHWHYTAEYIGPVTDPENPDSAYISLNRVSKIHYTDYYKRCLFADKYSGQLSNGNGQLTYLNELPFNIANIEHHRDEVCPYCFFGGPDKHSLK